MRLTLARLLGLWAPAVVSFQPAQIAGNKLWLRADLGLTPNGADLAVWADQSGQANHAAQATPANQPLIEAASATFNGRPCITFTRANGDHLVADSLAALVSGTAKPYEFFAVFSIPALANTRTLYGFGRSSSATPTLDGRISSTSLPASLKTTDAGTAILNTAAGALTADTRHVIRFSSSGTHLSVYVDGVVTSIAAIAEAAGAMTVDRFTIGATRLNSTAMNLFNGSIAELIAYDHQLIVPDAAAVMTYINARY